MPRTIHSLPTRINCAETNACGNCLSNTSKNTRKRSLKPSPTAKHQIPTVFTFTPRFQASPLSSFIVLHSSFLPPAPSPHPAQSPAPAPPPPQTPPSPAPTAQTPPPPPSHTNPPQNPANTP